MGRNRKYTPDGVRREVERYFRSLSRVRTVTEEAPSGETDKYGHPIMEAVPVLDMDGNEMQVTEFVRPPTVGGICRALGICRDTWSAWGHEEGYGPVVQWARETMQDYLETEMLVRAGKDVRGVEFTLSANYGVSEKKTVELGPRAAGAVGVRAMPMEEREALLREIAGEFGGDG